MLQTILVNDIAIELNTIDKHRKRSQSKLTVR